MTFFDHAFHKSGVTELFGKPRATAKPPCVIHPLNVQATPGDAPPNFMKYRLECLTIRTISSRGSDGTMTRRPALVVQMLLENSDDSGDGATYSLRTMASLTDLKILRHPQADEAELKACHYYETKLPLAQQEPVGGRRWHKAAQTQSIIEADVPLLTRLQRIFA